VAALSWYPLGTNDDEGKSLDSFIFTILDMADEFGVKVCKNEP